jgi:hypothetical protein
MKTASGEVGSCAQERSTSVPPVVTMAALSSEGGGGGGVTGAAPVFWNLPVFFVECSQP